MSIKKSYHIETYK